MMRPILSVGSGDVMKRPPKRRSHAESNTDDKTHIDLMVLRRFFYNSLWLVAALACLGGAAHAQDNRLALVIGNSDYRESPLTNPVNDANDMAQVLESLGFDVMLHIDVNRREMARAIREFGRELKAKRGVGLFYFAGHGMQLENRNFLIPVDTPMEEEDEVPYESIDVGSVLAKMESAGNALNLLILDACRNNPFPRQFRSSSRGLARVQAPVGSLVVYATAPGDVAADGEGRNGVFTGALLEQLRTPGLSLTQTIRRTRAAVVNATGGRQVPWESSSLMQDYYFATEPAPAPEAKAATTPFNNSLTTTRVDTPSEPQDASSTTTPATDLVIDSTDTILRIEPEVIFWNSVQAGNTAAEYQAYLSRYPDGLFAALATARLATINTERTVEPPDSTLESPDNPVQESPLAKKDLQTASVDTAMTSQLTTKSISAESLEPEPGNISALARLTVSTIPSDARIRIMNIVEKYAPGITLDRSRTYDVYVTKPGYESYRENITLDKDDVDIAVTLRERDLRAPQTVALPGGSFTMGCSAGDRRCEAFEKPARTVNISAFSMTRTEVTVAQFASFTEASGYITDAQKNAGGNLGCYIWQDKGGISRSAGRWTWVADANWRKPGYEQRADFPVTCISWNDAQAYAKWLSRKTGRAYRLPSETEWEYAARAGHTAAFGASEDARGVCRYANVADTTQSPKGSKWSDRIACNDGHWFSAPVASFEANPLGLFDMQGNVWEWVEDHWTDDLNSAPANGQAYEKRGSNDHVLRGGAWDGDEKRVRLSSRSKGRDSSRTAMTGFRLVMEP